MELKLFGKSLFSFNKKNHLYGSGLNEVRKSKYLPDFQKNESSGIEWASISDSVNITQTSGTGSFIGNNLSFVPGPDKELKVENPKKAEEIKKKTPKEVHELKLLHDLTFKINTDPKYVDEQLEDFKTKLSMISDEEYDMRRGVEEIGAIVLRLENRKKYPAHAKFYGEFPYTTRTKVSEMLAAHNYLKLGQVAQFLADMPAEATKVMKQYTDETVKLCGLKPVFYIIADKKDFQKTEKRRDPILLAQSPFGVAWQILGAWDKEMLLVDEL